VRLDHLLSREAPGLERSLRRPAHHVPAQPERLPKCRPDLGAPERELERLMLLSFERPAPSQGSASSRTLKTAQPCQQTGITGRRSGLWAGEVPDHRQDRKGTRWMPWHQESKKGVDGCDKPRGVAEQAVIRGFPNGETQRW
jgi:hypothetical protein